MTREEMYALLTPAHFKAGSFYWEREDGKTNSSFCVSAKDGAAHPSTMMSIHRRVGGDTPDEIISVHVEDFGDVAWGILRYLWNDFVDIQYLWGDSL